MYATATTNNTRKTRLLFFKNVFDEDKGLRLIIRCAGSLQGSQKQP
jgi:hypothetical protein